MGIDNCAACEPWFFVSPCGDEGVFFWGFVGEYVEGDRGQVVFAEGLLNAVEAVDGNATFR